MKTKTLVITDSLPCTCSKKHQKRWPLMTIRATGNHSFPFAYSFSCVCGAYISQRNTEHDLVKEWNEINKPLTLSQIAETLVS